MAIVLETKRLSLRHMTPADLESLAKLYGDPEVVRYIGPGVPPPREEIKRIFACALTDEQYAWTPETIARLPQLLIAKEKKAHFSMWAACEKTSGKFVGRCGLLAWDLDGQKEVEVGYLLAREYWGKGLATEAAMASRDYAMDVLGFDRVISVIKPENLGSQRVALKNGMRHERDTMVKEWPVRLFSITRVERDRISAQ